MPGVRRCSAMTSPVWVMVVALRPWMRMMTRLKRGVTLDEPPLMQLMHS